MKFEIAIHQFQSPSAGVTYGFLLHFADQNKTLGIDCGAAQPVLELLEQKEWQLDELWITHHHFDHIAGLEEVKQATGCVVTGPDNSSKPIAGLDRLAVDGDELLFAGSAATVIHAPGHSDDMLNYYFASLGICFVGDVLFPLGCGRLNGSPVDMWSSLQKLAGLPESTKLYSCHEYAENNARFALSVEPTNQAVLNFYQAITDKRANCEPTVPSVLGDELNANPFLRAHDLELRTAIGITSDALDVDVFAKLRAMKDRF